MSLEGLSTLAVLTSILATTVAQTTAEDDCPSRRNVAAIVVGTIAATLAVVAVILAIAILWWRRQQKGKAPSMTNFITFVEVLLFSSFSEYTGSVPHKTCVIKVI